ncbi:MAG: tetratricopeptide repeat protein [Pirellula sp.]
MQIEANSLDSRAISIFRAAAFSKLLSCLFLLASPGCHVLHFDFSDFDSTVGSRETSPFAIHHNKKGLKYLAQGKTGKAETHFLKAIDFDPAFAAAHNNLGNMLFARRDLYQAAWQFQRAAELEPDSIEPLINLGLIHDEADRLDEATEFYQQALEIDPQNPIAIGNLARVLIKQDHDPTEIQSLLRDLTFLDTRIEWVEWAQELLATRYRSDYGMKPSTASDPARSPESTHGMPQPYDHKLPPNLHESNAPSQNTLGPLNIEQVLPVPHNLTNPGSAAPKSQSSIEPMLPTPIKAAPIITPSLMDISPNYSAGNSSLIVKPAAPNPNTNAFQNAPGPAIRSLDDLPGKPRGTR